MTLTVIPRDRRHLRTLSAPELIKEARAADAAVKVEVDRLWRDDPAFREAIDRSLMVEDEQIRRRTGR